MVVHRIEHTNSPRSTRRASSSSNGISSSTCSDFRLLIPRAALLGRPLSCTSRPRVHLVQLPSVTSVLVPPSHSHHKSPLRIAHQTPYTREVTRSRCAPIRRSGGWAGASALMCSAYLLPTCALGASVHIGNIEAHLYDSPGVMPVLLSSMLPYLPPIAPHSCSLRRSSTSPELYRRICGRPAWSPHVPLFVRCWLYRSNSCAFVYILRIPQPSVHTQTTATSDMMYAIV